MLKIWTLCENSGEVAVLDVAKIPSLNFRSAVRIIESSSADLLVALASVFEDCALLARLSLAGVTGRVALSCATTAAESRLAGVTLLLCSLHDSDAKASSRFFECCVQNCMYRAVILW